MPLIALGLPELLIIGGVFVLMFGAKKLPGLGGAIGEGIKNFKKGISPEEDKKLEGEKADDKNKPS
jgi:sec-independent protein translocase protein TatA